MKFLKNKNIKLFFIFFIFISFACNRDETIEKNIDQKPIIELDSEDGAYLVKTGRELSISPTVKHAENAQFSWIIDNQLVGTEASFSGKWDVPGVIYILFRVETKAGKAEEELRVDVADLAPPIISLNIPPGGIKLLAGSEYQLTPDIQNKDLGDFKCEWIRDGIVVFSGMSYLFSEEQTGTYPLKIKAANADGETIKEIDIRVVESILEVEFEQQSYHQKSTDRYTFLNRPIFLYPLISNFVDPHFVWMVNGDPTLGATNRILKFSPDSYGEYSIKLIVSEGSGQTQAYTRNITRTSVSASATVKVLCVEKNEDDLYRAAKPESRKEQNKVYEYTPAPGQFVGETVGFSGFTGNELTPQAAVEYAERRMSKEGKEYGSQYVSLGGFGGYIIVGFDHSIVNSGGDYDFSIQGNAFDRSSEPGIVWVMQDVNGNGLPDDEWYELKGSETGKSETIQDYSVTYFRPGGPKMNVKWLDSKGEQGFIKYLIAHQQDYYYPTWVLEESYTLRGTCLKARNVQQENGDWNNAWYDWGYAANFGEDKLIPNPITGEKQQNRFKISNAMCRDGTPVDLKYIDFIKVQVGVNAKSGWLGEISTEVFSFSDLSITK